MTQDAPKVWFITGASGGLGLAFAKAALDAGDTVLALARRPELLADLEAKTGGRLHAVGADVTDAAAVARAVADGVRHAGRIDVLVNNVGRGLFGPVEELTADELRGAFEINVIGALNVLKSVLPHMRSRRSGQVLNISSMAGMTGSAGLGAYCAAKFALEGLSEALAEELEPLGLRVTLVEPGPFPTAWGRSSDRTQAEITDYAGLHRRLDGMNDAHFAVGDIARAARALVELTRLAEPPLRAPLGSVALAAGERKLARASQDYAAGRDRALSADTQRPVTAAAE